MNDIRNLDLTKYTAFFFDLDGTLIGGSDQHFVRCVKETGEEFGHSDLIIPSGSPLGDFLRERLNANDELVSEFRKRNRERMKTTDRPVHYHEDALEFIRAYREVPRAIVTNCCDWEVALTERTLPLNEHFEVVVYNFPEIRSKPAGDLYLHAAKLLEANPKTSIVFEDSPTGIAAGKDAGMTVVGIDRGTHSNFAEADFVISSFAELL